MSVINGNRSGIHYVVVPRATQNDVVTAVGVNKLLAGTNTAVLNGVNLCEMHSRMMPKSFALPPSQEMVEMPFLGKGRTIQGLLSMDKRIELPHGFDRLMCMVDLSFAFSAEVIRLYMRTDQGAFWEFAEIFGDINLFSTSSTLPIPGPDAIEALVSVGRQKILIDLPMPQAMLPPIGKAEERFLRMTYKGYDNSFATNVPAGIFNLSAWVYKS